MLLIAVFVYSLALWLGLYLLARDSRRPLLRWAGLGLVAYGLAVALAVGVELVAGSAAEPALAASMLAVQRPFLLLPGLFWAAALWVLPEPDNAPAWPVWLAAGIACAAGLLLPATAFWAVGAAIILALLLGAGRVIRRWRALRPRRPIVLLLLATLFFGLGGGLLLLPFDLLPAPWFLLAISVDMAFLGLVVAVLDAFDEGEALLPDIARSLAQSVLTALVFGGQVALIMIWTGATLPMVALLLATIGAAIAWQTFADAVQSGFDRLALARFPRIRQARQQLRSAASAVARADETLDPTALPDEEFVRLTRRALSQMGNLPRLAASPLTRLPVVEQRLSDRRGPADTLARAHELKMVLTESIVRLRPPGGAGFGTTDAWRFYNALYFPYVVGLKPYRRRASYDQLAPEERSALDWFRAQVPERTLYNWQNTAAELVAQQLREQADN